MYKDTITLFNYFESKQTDTYLWFPTVLHNVDLNLDKAAILAKTGEKSQDNAILHVRIPNGSKPWIPPIEWGKQVRDDLREAEIFSGMASGLAQIQLITTIIWKGLTIIWSRNMTMYFG